MCHVASVDPPDPGWGDQDRPEKAAAILTTLRLVTGLDFSNSHWVDIGCGCGEIAANIAPEVGRITAIDPSPWQRWSKLKHDHLNLEFIQGDYTNDYPEPNSIDVVICNQVYEHVPDPEALIEFIHHILRPSGYAYFAGPNLFFPIEPHVYWPFIHWLPRNFAIKLMKMCGAKYIIDANLVSIWTLRRWLHKFKVINAVPTILQHPNNYDRASFFWHVFRAIPHYALDHLTAISPGFVFILQKQKSH